MPRTGFFTTYNPQIAELLNVGHVLMDLRNINSLLDWDQETYMPQHGAVARGFQCATLAGVIHEKLTYPALGELLKRLRDEMEREPASFSLHDKALVREMRRSYDRAVKIPSRLVQDIAQATSSALEVWKKARDQNNFGVFAGSLGKVLDLKKQEADFIGFKRSPLDALLDDFEPGLTVEKAGSILNQLRIEIQPLVKRYGSTKTADITPLKRRVENKRLWDFTIAITEAMGFDFGAGRQDISTHPFTTNFDPSDVRITTRFGEELFTSTIFSSIHEAGHGLYEQGCDPGLARTYLCGGISLGVHESQSRFWENVIGRSPAFWRYWYPKLQQIFAEELDGYSIDNFIGAINKVKPGPIRVDADEATYNLHIVVRFEIERDLFEGKIRASDLPEIWNQKMQEYLGVTPPDDTRGVLQDIHWAGGSFGYFPTYTIGNLLAAQLWHKFLEDNPNAQERIAQGELAFIREWLRLKIHRHGSTYQPNDLIEQVTGEKLDPAYFKRYLEQKLNSIFE